MKFCDVDEFLSPFSATSSATGTNSIEDELGSYASAVQSYSGNNALEFCINAESSFPLLAPYAEDLISAPGSQAYVERVFSVCSDLTSGKSSRLTKNLKTKTFLKMNCRYYNWTLHKSFEHCGTVCCMIVTFSKVDYASVCVQLNVPGVCYNSSPVHVYEPLFWTGQLLETLQLKAWAISLLFSTGQTAVKLSGAEAADRAQCAAPD